LLRRSVVDFKNKNEPDKAPATGHFNKTTAMIDIATSGKVILDKENHNLAVTNVATPTVCNLCFSTRLTISVIRRILITDRTFGL
jgi:hypothetical protein